MLFRIIPVRPFGAVCIERTSSDLILSLNSSLSVIFKDVPPFVTVWGNRAEAYGINKEGLRRNGFNADTIRALHQAYKIIYKQNLTIEQAIEELKALSRQYEEVRQLTLFLQQSSRGIVR